MDGPTDARRDDRQRPSAPHRAAADRAPGEEGRQYRLCVVTRPGAGLGFRLAGVRVEEVAETRAAERLMSLLAEPDLGVLAVEEDLLRQVPEAILVSAGRDGVPVVLPFALPRQWGEGGRAEEYVAALIRRAIGYHIKIQA